MSDSDKTGDTPDPARAALDKPHLTSGELEEEVGNSEPWDEASEEDLPQDVDADAEDPLV